MRVVGVPKEVALRDRLDFVVEVFEGVLVRELDDVVFEGADVFEKLTRHCRHGSVGEGTYFEGAAIRCSA